ncbi:Eco29kI family restriction endonuclease [Micromonospora pisi]|uniref:Eco29kI family restriction endonuclease n=1 Tax=Micromonospora pisi TaxID=589240 RepID=UPI00147780BA|nr:Eco29kI family restriction endonuclease [Micromonospora pisi]
MLFLDGERVYVGKAARSLQDRLSQHYQKISGRSGIDLNDVRFVCVYVDEDLDAAAPEKLLIKKYRAHDSIPWNTNGFGNKDPGRNRDTSLVKKVHFDATYPIDLGYRLSLEPGSQPVAAALEVAKRELPYLLRFDNGVAAKKIYRDTTVSIPDEPMVATDLIEHLIRALPHGWQLTALPGYLIMYAEDREYASALAWWKRNSTGVTRTEGPGHFAAGRVEPEDSGSESGEPA